MTPPLDKLSPAQRLDQELTDQLIKAAITQYNTDKQEGQLYPPINKHYQEKILEYFKEHPIDNLRELDKYPKTWPSLVNQAQEFIKQNELYRQGGVGPIKLNYHTIETSSIKDLRKYIQNQVKVELSVEAELKMQAIVSALHISPQTHRQTHQERSL